MNETRDRSKPECADAAVAPNRRRARAEGGAALLIAVLMLVMMGLIGISSMDTVMRDRQIAGYTSRARSALYAADAGVAAALDIVRSSPLPNALAPGDCLDVSIPKTDLPGGTASYQADTTAPGNLCVLTSSEPCAELDASLEIGAGTTYRYTVWDMRIQGQTSDGATARVQATAQRCHAFN